MPQPNRRSLIWLLAAVVSGGLYAQFRSDVRLVVLHASVTDKHGKLLTNLKQSAFKVFENGQPQQVKRFRQEDVPVSLGIIIDDSGSMSNKRRSRPSVTVLSSACNPSQHQRALPSSSSVNDAWNTNQRYSPSKRRNRPSMSRATPDC